jgi:hypothetical protein
VKQRERRREEAERERERERALWTVNVSRDHNDFALINSAG